MSEAAGPVFLDSNILIYAEHQFEPNHAASKYLRDRCLLGEIESCLSPQVTPRILFCCYQSSQHGYTPFVERSS